MIYSVNNTNIYYIINIINLATCFGSLNHPQANSYNKVKVHSASADLYLYFVVRTGLRMVQ